MNIKFLLNLQKGIAFVISFLIFIPFSYNFYEPFIDIKRGLSYLAIFSLSLIFFSMKKKIRISKTLFILGLLIFFTFISLLWTQNKALSLFSITNYIYFFVLFIIAQNSMAIKQGLFNGLISSALLLGVYVLLQSFKIDPFDLGGRIATIGNSNYLGIILLFWTAFFFFSYIFETKCKKDILFFLFFAFSLIFGARMRSAVLAFFSGLTLYSLYKKNKIFISIMFLLMIVGIILISGELLKGRPSFLIRYYIGRDSLKGVFSSINNTFLGFGENSYLDSFAKFRSVEAFKIGGKNVYSITSHNIFIDYLFELGIIGLTIFLLIIININKELDNKMKYVFFTVLIGAQFINPIKHISTFFIFYLPIIFCKNKRALKKTKTILGILIFILMVFSIGEFIRLKNSVAAMNYYKNKFPSYSLTTYDSGEYLFEKANFYRRQAKFKKAEIAYLKCLEKLPYYIPALLNAGQMYYNMKDYNKAYKYYDKVIGLNPNHSDAWFFKGVIEYNNVQYKESKKSLEKAYVLSDKKDKQALELLLKIKRQKFDILDK